MNACESLVGDCLASEYVPLPFPLKVGGEEIQAEPYVYMLY